MSTILNKKGIQINRNKKFRQLNIWTQIQCEVVVNIKLYNNKKIKYTNKKNILHTQPMLNA